MDFLGLRNLTILADSVALIEQTTGKKIDPYNLPQDDPETYALLCRGETKHCLIGKAGLPVRIRTHYPEIHALMLRWLEESAQSAASVQ